MSLLVIAHIYYPAGWEYLLERLLHLKSYPCACIFNVVGLHDDKKLLVQYLNRHFPDAIIIDAPNHGRDIGGKLAALDVSLKLNLESDLTLIVHDKQSGHTLDGIGWRNELLKIVDTNQLPSVLAKFENNDKLGLLAAQKFIMNEYDFRKQKFASFSDEILRSTIHEMNLRVTDYSFVAGNVFWIRSLLLKKFFRAHHPLAIRSRLEHGNELDFHKGTHIHSWERIFSWIPNMYGYDLAGI